MDLVLHAERLNGRTKRRHRCSIDGLPDGAFVVLEEGAWAVRADSLQFWTPEGYDTSKRRPRGTMVDVLTPPAIIGALAAGYRPHWHPTAEVISSPP
jgi:hypothetical protein